MGSPFVPPSAALLKAATAFKIPYPNHLHIDYVHRTRTGREEGKRRRKCKAKREYRTDRRKFGRAESEMLLLAYVCLLFLLDFTNFRVKRLNTKDQNIVIT